jgi:hypothetical protein
MLLQWTAYIHKKSYLRNQVSTYTVQGRWGEADITTCLCLFWSFKISCAPDAYISLINICVICVHHCSLTWENGCERCSLGVVSHNVDWECYQHTSLSLFLIQEKDVRLYEFLKEEVAILAKEEGFQNVREDDIVELLESHSLPLMNE